ncbi:hypothetical protein SAMN04489727_1738 [Amycolatopsis tolypomycina]|uniref:Uncharacterized protein n=1 Tax=Amycolatopsis tolypomycina TaxID=208445 RepID=A0A1H4JBJ3_9PSEU|nr:hypothetical protein [Amycolatopsis tolypomycina]SEB43729.1 hypothetical protein SAMN04489727_1738 [Amycolatopsis tolypomycina]
MGTETDAYSENDIIQLLQHAARRVTKAKKELLLAERARRIDAAIATRLGLEKTATAAELGITRPTLDAWLVRVAQTADEQKEVDQHFALMARRDAKAVERKAARRG